MLRINLEINDDNVYEQLKTPLAENSSIKLIKADDATFSLTGDEVVSFILLSVASGLSYEAFRAYLAYFGNVIQVYYGSSKKSFRVTINGIIYLVKSEKDIDKVLNALIKEYEDVNKPS